MKEKKPRIEGIRHRRALYDNTEQNWSQYKNERNAVVKLIREKKKEYYENMINFNKENSATMWKILKEIIRGETRYKGSRKYRF